VHVLPDDHIGEGARRLSGILGDEDPDALARIPDSRMPESRMALCASHRVVLVAAVMVRKSCGEIPSSLRETGKSTKAPTWQ